jgi:hypothetical protein
MHVERDAVLTFSNDAPVQVVERGCIRYDEWRLASAGIEFMITGTDVRD